MCVTPNPEVVAVGDIAMLVWYTGSIGLCGGVVLVVVD